MNEQTVNEQTVNEQSQEGTHGTNVVSDVLVVGGGLAGLTAALSAARAGATVTLLDAHSLGGRARSTTRSGFTLNEGGHALYNGAGRTILDGLGAVVRGSSPDTGDYQLVWDGERVSFPITPVGLMTTPLLGVRSRAKLVSILAGLGRKLPDDSLSVDAWLEQRGARPDLCKYLTAVLRLGSYAADPGAQPAGMMFRRLLAGQRGVVYVDGGWQSIVAELQRLSIDAGVSIVERCPVRSLVQEGGIWSAIGDERQVRGRAVVLAAGGPAQAVSLLGDDTADWVTQAGEPQRAACLDIGGRTAGAPFLLSADEPLYLSLHAPVADLAPDGSSLYAVMRYLESDADRDAERNRAELERHAAIGALPRADDRGLERFLAAPVVSWGRPTVGLDRPTGMERAREGVFAAGDWMGDQLLADAAIVSGKASGLAAAKHARNAAGMLAR